MSQVKLAPYGTQMMVFDEAAQTCTRYNVVDIKDDFKDWKISGEAVEVIKTDDRFAQMFDALWKKCGSRTM